MQKSIDNNRMSFMKMSTDRPKNKKKARELRSQGWSVPRISQDLNVSKSSAYTWTKDLPVPEQLTPEYRAKRKEDHQNAKDKRRLDKIRNRNSKRLPLLSRKIVGPDWNKVYKYSGYYAVYYPDHPKSWKKGYIFVHRLVAEYTLERILEDDEIVHHKNGNKVDNRAANLEIMRSSEHSRHHKQNLGIRMVQLRCPECRKLFVRERRNTFLVKGGQFTSCSRTCGSKFSYRLRKGQLKDGSVFAENVVEEFKG